MNKKIIGVIIDNKLNFKSHINELCKRVSEKIGALCRLSSYLNNCEKKNILNSITKSQFNYFLLVWIFCSRKPNNMINKFGEITQNCIE